MNSEIRPGYALPLLLLNGFRTIIEELHRELARQGHPDVRPAHGFAMQAISRGSDTVTGLARALGVTKQAAAKTAQGLERLGYIKRAADPTDRRSQRLVPTVLGADMLQLSATVLAAIRADWATRLGGSEVDDLEDALRAVVGPPDTAGTVDLPGWLAG